MGAGASSKKYETVADEWAALFAEAVAKEQALFILQILCLQCIDARRTAAFAVICSCSFS